MQALLSNNSTLHILAVRSLLFLPRGQRSPWGEKWSTREEVHLDFLTDWGNRHNFLSVSPSMRAVKHLHSWERANPFFSWELLYHRTKRHKKGLCYPRNSTGPFVTYNADHTAVEESEFQTADKGLAEWGSYRVWEQNPRLGDFGSKHSDELVSRIDTNTSLTSFYAIFPPFH